MPSDFVTVSLIFELLNETDRFKTSFKKVESSGKENTFNALVISFICKVKSGPLINISIFLFIFPPLDKLNLKPSGL